MLDPVVINSELISYLWSIKSKKPFLFILFVLKIYESIARANSSGEYMQKGLKFSRQKMDHTPARMKRASDSEPLSLKLSAYQG